ncbi:MAG: signal peptidase I [Gammaproteobacteria bacterium]|nr:signal peptidase I [Gammaproteobacteria bacterium]
MGKLRITGTLIAALAGGVAARWTYQRLARFEISEVSMAPTLRPGDRVLTWERTPRRGDIVVFEHPTKPGFWLVKRIIGLPEEHVAIRNGNVFVDGSVLEEPWAKEPTGPEADWRLGAHEAIVLGDARHLSAGDSRQLGPLPVDALLHTVIARYWPDPARIA